MTAGMQHQVTPRTLKNVELLPKRNRQRNSKANQ
jgi:hypothetical protein